MQIKNESLPASPSRARAMSEHTTPEMVTKLVNRLERAERRAEKWRRRYLFVLDQMRSRERHLREADERLLENARR